MLGHPAVKAVLTQAGINSAYEAASHAEPVFAVPLIADQPKHAVNVKQTNLPVAKPSVIASAFLWVSAACSMRHVWLLAALLVDSERMAVG